MALGVPLTWGRPPATINVYSGATAPAGTAAEPAVDVVDLAARVEALESQLAALREIVEHDHRPQLIGLQEKVAGQYGWLNDLEHRVSPRRPGRPTHAEAEARLALTRPEG